MSCGSVFSRNEERFYWRRGWDLNPRYPFRYVRFRGGSFQPLTHLSALKPGPSTRLRSLRISAAGSDARKTPNFRGGSFQLLTHLSALNRSFDSLALAQDFG